MTDNIQGLGRRELIAMLMAATTLGACETLDADLLGDILGAGGNGLLSQEDAAAGIRAALDNGIGAALFTVGKQDGFALNNLIRIPLPKKLADIQSTLAGFGASGILDELALQLNRGAEIAAPVAKDIFLDAVSGLSIADAIGIVRGPKNAATAYLQDRTTARLTQLFAPIMENALAQTGALRLLDQIDAQVAGVGLGSIGRGAKTDLIAHGVKYGLSGVFHYIEEEERLIRENPAKRTSEILRRVFGAYT